MRREGDFVESGTITVAFHFTSDRVTYIPLAESIVGAESILDSNVPVSNTFCSVQSKRLLINLNLIDFEIKTDTRVKSVA